MLQESVLDMLYSKRKTVGEFNYDMLMAPNIYTLLSQGDIDSLYNITTSGLYSGNTPKKKKAMDEIMARRGFKKFAFGTNRMVYRFLEDQSFVVKVPLHDLALSDNIREMENQDLLKPFCCKCFQVVHNGEVGLFERVMPITNKLEYKSVADDVFDLIVNKVIGKLVMEDIGTEYFMNIGIRKNFGVVLIDYPEVFVLDGNKLYCNAPVIPNTKFPVCGGCIDYDDGFNRLICKKCGKIYKGRELEASIKNNLVAIKGGTNMKQPRVRLVRGNEVIVDNANTTYGVDVIKRSTEQTSKSFGRKQPVVRLVQRDSSGAIVGYDSNPLTTNIGSKMPSDVSVVYTSPDTDNQNKFLKEKAPSSTTKKPAAKTASKSTSKTTAKPVAKTASKPATKTASKPIAKTATKVSDKPQKAQSFEDFVKAEEDQLKKDILDDNLREFVKAVLASNELAGHWRELTEAQKKVIIENAQFICTQPNVKDEPDPLPVSVEDVEKVEKNHKNKANSDRLKPNEQVINHAKKSTFIPEDGNIDAY